MRDIGKRIGSPRFNRLRIGIGRVGIGGVVGSGDSLMSDFVLGAHARTRSVGRSRDCHVRFLAGGSSFDRLHECLSCIMPSYLSSSFLRAATTAGRVARATVRRPAPAARLVGRFAHHERDELLPDVLWFAAHVIRVYLHRGAAAATAVANSCTAAEAARKWRAPEQKR